MEKTDRNYEIYKLAVKGVKHIKIAELHGISSGRVSQIVNEQRKKNKSTKTRNQHMKNMYRNGFSYREIANEFNVSNARVWQIVNDWKKQKDKNPNNLGGKWEDYKTAEDRKGIERIDWWDVMLLSAVAVAVVIIIGKFIVW